MLASKRARRESALKSRKNKAYKKSAKPKKQNAIYIIVLLAIVTYAIVYSIVNVGGPSFYGDDTVYLNLAYAFLSGNFMESPFIFSVRILQFLPIALFYKLFGINVLSSSAWDILSFVGTIIAVYFIGEALYRRSGMIAAFLMAFFPLVVQLSATVSDDIPLMFIASLAMLSMVYARKKNSKPWYFLFGIFLVASPLVTPEGFIAIVIAVVYAVIELARRTLHIDRTTLYAAYGILVACILLIAFNYLYSSPHNPLITLTVNSHFYSEVGGSDTIPSTNTNLGFYINTMFPYGFLATFENIIRSKTINFAQLWNQINAQGSNTAGLYFYYAVIAAIYLLAKKERSSYIPLLWLSVGFGYLEFGPMHVSLLPFSYLLSYRLGRFLTIIAPAAALTIGIAIARATECGSKFKTTLAFAIIALGLILLVVTSLPINTFWHETLVYERYSQLQIAQYLSGLPNTTKIYYTGSFALVPCYMGFENLSRFYAYDSMHNCAQIPANSYVIIPYNEIFNINFTADPTRYCPSWRLVMAPLLSGYPQSITGPGMVFQAKLYYVPQNASSEQSNATAIGHVNTTVNSSQSSIEINFFNLTGVGIKNETTGKILKFFVVNNVTSVSIALNKSSAAPGENVSLNVTYEGTFLWGNGSRFAQMLGKEYLSSPVINVHYYGVELSNQSSMLYDQNNGPWNLYISQVAAPRQVIYNDTSKYLRIIWIISPKANAAGKELKLCGGYFAAYANTTLYGGWAYLYNNLSYLQKYVANDSVINIPSRECAYLNVT